MNALRPFSRLLSSAARLQARPKWNPPQDLRYALRELEESGKSPSGWRAPLGGYETLPFRVFRTEKGKQIPVYTDYRNGRTRCMTMVRRFRGDVDVLAEEMSRVCDNNMVIVRPGRMEVKGNYRDRVEEWLLRLGF